ncbi:c-type cytochrome [Lentisphaera marina]|uniref:DUF7133 domain-containing protein n=1 Tax=Lentisphaera marina TaxID=1111041 RepID=UPI002366C176|nr:c-type cytochrome [Lentisphaera marina]MDD7985527.1 c-type cytochrome [Lentisphaera marina]
MKLSKLITPLLMTSSFSAMADLGSVSRDNIIKDPVPVHLEAQESLKQIEVPSNYKIELVASEPMVEEPVCMAWGSDGELYVAEMLTYMLNLDATDEKTPRSRVIKLVDSNGDGKMDKRTVYLDNLTLPRAILVLDKKVVIGEPPNLWICEDTNGDGVADKKEKMNIEFGRLERNVEHDINGLQWTLDNWIYCSKSSLRFRYKDGKLIEGKVPFRGQWGHTTNNRGERFNTTNTVPVISDIVKSHYLQDSQFARKHPHIFSSARESKKYLEVFPVCGTLDTQGGRGINRVEEATLHKFTAVCGQTFFRGDRLGKELENTYWACEPVGRLIRASKVEYKNGYQYVENILEKEEAEFIASRDPLFRPVNAYTAPDGTLWFADMYRGIIQQGNWTREGSYLRKEIERRGLDKFTGKGRIYRLVNKNIKPSQLPKFSQASTAELIVALSNPNGWWRDEAQKLLILRNAPDAISLLKKNLKRCRNEFGRVHSIWALEGLDAWTPELALTMMNDSSEDVRLSALRACDSLIPEASPKFVHQLTQASGNDTIAVTVQKLMTLSLAQTKEDIVEQVLNTIAKNFQDEVVSKSVLITLTPNEAFTLLTKISNDPKFNSSIQLLPQYLSLYVMSEGKAKGAEDYLNLLAKSKGAFAQSMIKGLSVGNSHIGTKMRPVNLPLIKLKQKPESLATIENSGLSSLELSPLTTCLTWPGEAKFANSAALRPLKADELKLYEMGQNIYRSVCIGCHGADAKGLSIPGGTQTMAPPLAGSARINDKSPRAFVEILLKGLTGPIDGKTYPGPMAAMGNNDDEWVAAISTYVRRSFGNTGEPVTIAETAKIRGWSKRRTKPYTIEELSLTKPPKPKNKKK